LRSPKSLTRSYTRPAQYLNPTDGSSCKTPASEARSGWQKDFLLPLALTILFMGLVLLPPVRTNPRCGNVWPVAKRHDEGSEISFTNPGWGNGIDFLCTSKVLVNGLFIRNSDDCIAIYGHRSGYFGDMKSVIVQNSALWADVAHPILDGTHGHPHNCPFRRTLLLANTVS